MGLAEKRKTEEMKKKWPEWEKMIHEALKTQIPIEVKWDTMVKEEQAGYAMEAFEAVFVKSAVRGFSEICADEMGKDALAGAVKKIVISNEKDVSSGARWFKFENGTVTLDHSFSNVDNVSDRANNLVEELSKLL